MLALGIKFVSAWSESWMRILDFLDTMYKKWEIISSTDIDF